MPIYTCRLIGNKKATPEFVSRGLDDLGLDTITAAEVFGLPDYVQVAYYTYSKLLPAFMKAAVENKRIPTNKTGYSFSLSPTSYIPLALPPITVTFPDTVAATVRERMKDTYEGTVFSNKQKQTKYTFPNPPLGLLRELTALGVNPTEPVPRGSMNLSAARSFLETLKIVTAFLMAHTYPAFTDDDTIDMTVFDVRFAGFITMKRAAGNLEKALAKKFREEGEEDADVAMETTEELESDEVMVGTEDENGSYDNVPWASPPDTPPAFLFSSPNNLPSTSGNVFPHFAGMLETDFSYIPAVMIEFFLLAFGENKDEILPRFKAWKSGHGVWCDTDQGRVLQHLFKGVQLAIQCQARLVPIILEDHSYQGFVICGGHYSVAANKKTFRPLTQPAFHAEAAQMTLHSVALEKIMKLLVAMKVDPSMKKVTAKRLPSEITSARDLWTQVKKRNVSSEDRVTIAKLANDLSFPQTFWKITGSTLKAALELISSNTLPEVTDPMYTGEGTLVEDDPVLTVLALFGPEAPSFILDGGKKFRIPTTAEDDAASVVPEGGKTRPLDVLVVARKSIRVAFKDYERMKLETAIYQKTPRAAAFKHTKLTAGDRDSVWAALRVLRDDWAEEGLDKVVRADRKDTSTGAVAENKAGISFDDF